MRVSWLQRGEMERRYQGVADGALIAALLVTIGLAVYLVVMGLD
jgi:tetrahydromethanopterin S-methyltransferase subunit F